jgi:hypothetical protein
MRRILITVVGIAAIVLPADAQQHTENGSDMIEACRIIASGTALLLDNALRAGTCRGEIDALNWIAPVIGDSSLRACVPTSVTQQQEAKVIVDFLAQNADRIREPFQGLALEALAGIWPCPKDKPGLLRRLWNRIAPDW